MHQQVFRAFHDVGSRVLVVSGSVDELAVDDFREALRAASEGSTRQLMINLDGVTFMPSMAVAVLMGALAAGPPGTKVSASPGTTARQVLELLGLYEFATKDRPGDGSGV